MSAADLVERTRDRADAVRYTGHSSVSERLRQAIVDTSSMRTAGLNALTDAQEKQRG